jgi:hypothetical protein
MNLRYSRTLFIVFAALAVAALVAAFVAGHARGRTKTGSPSPSASGQLAPAGIVQVSHDQFGGHVEPSVAVNPRDPRNLLAASRVFQGQGRDLATYASFDGGQTWQSNGILPGSALGDDANVTVTFDQAGHGYVSGMVTRSTAGGGAPVYVWRTDDGGRHFRPAVAAMRGNADHPGLAADPAVGSADLYLAGIVFDGSAGRLRFTRSTDSGRSFEPARSIDPSDSPYDRLAVVAAGPDGTVAVMYYVEPPDGSTAVAVATSTDHGASFAAPVRLAAIGPSAPAPGVSTRSGPAIAIDPRTGNIYASVTTRAPATGASQVEVFTSRDHGRSWTGPAVAASTVGSTYFQPQLAVGDGGQVGLSVFELAGGRVQVVTVTSASAGVSFDPPRPVAGSSFDPALGLTNGDGTAGPRWIGNYQGLTATPGAFHPMWTGTGPGHLELFTATIPVASLP